MYVKISWNFNTQYAVHLSHWNVDTILKSFAFTILVNLSIIYTLGPTQVIYGNNRKPYGMYNYNQ